MTRRLNLLNLCSRLTRYAEGLALQERLSEQVKSGVQPDTLVLVQVRRRPCTGHGWHREGAREAHLRGETKEHMYMGAVACCIVWLPGPTSRCVHPMKGIQ